MTLEELVAEILSQAREGYKHQVMCIGRHWVDDLSPASSKLYRNEIHVIIPIPRRLLVGVDLEALYRRLSEPSSVLGVKEYEKLVIEDEDGEVLMNLFQQDLVAVEMTFKSFRDIELS